MVVSPEGRNAWKRSNSRKEEGRKEHIAVVGRIYFRDRDSFRKYEGFISL